jgi:hypothetical protein
MYQLARTAVAYNRYHIIFGLAAFAALWTLLLPHRPVDFASSGVAAWWMVLCAVGVVNVVWWHRSAAALVHRHTTAERAVHIFQWCQLLLSAAFVFGCCFRSIVPRADVQRMGLIDSWVSSVMVGRSVATVAELCFMAQWALLLYGISREAGSRFGVIISCSIVPLIAVAEICSWYAVLTTCYAGNAIEESIWAISASLLIVGCLAVWSRSRAECRPFLAVVLVLGVGYVAFMCAVDVPMYVSRWLADEASGRQYLSFVQGSNDAWSRRVITFDWEQWRTEIPWMTLYFSVGVWLSLSLVHAPWFRSKSQVTTADSSAG